MIPALRGVSLGLLLVLFQGPVTLADAQPSAENAARGGWRLSWNAVDRGVVSWGTEAHFSSWDEYLAARAEAIQRGVQKSSDRWRDEAILRVVHFMCNWEPAWLIVVTKQSRAGATSEDRLGTFSSEAECLASLELEVDFKARSLEKFGSRVSLMQAEPSRWTVMTTEARGIETGQPTTVSAYRCIDDRPQVLPTAAEP
jgi:hypothetical protein